MPRKPMEIPTMALSSMQAGLLAILGGISGSFCLKSHRESGWREIEGAAGATGALAGDF
jgi:hypothetical protein